MTAPSVILCALQYSGGSTIDPILRELLARKGYNITPFGPEGTDRLRSELVQGSINPPFYHWTHDPVETFEGMIGNADYRFIYLHSDPRDVAVSWGQEFERNGICEGMTYAQILEMVVTHNLPPHVKAAVRWIESDCKVITSRQMKEGMLPLVQSILNYACYFETDRTLPGMPLSSSEIEGVIKKHSFESQWKKYFNTELIKKCNQVIGQELVSLGYELSSEIEQQTDVIDENNQPSSSQFCDSWAQRASLQVSGFTNYQIISPPFSCGVAWLINALLALDIKTTNVGFEPSHWEYKSEEWVLGEKALNHLKWHLPVLHERQQFSFPEQKEVFWEHRMDFARIGSCATILFVRDPRDAIYSLYRRNYAKNMEFIQYLMRPDEWPDHFPGLFQLPPFETFAYFVFFWMAMGNSMPVKLIHFEDTKQSPIRIMKEILHFLGVERTDKQIEAAIASSSFENAKQAMEKMEQATNQEFKTARKGACGEWKTVYSEVALGRTQGIGALLLECLGYEPGRTCSSETWIFSGYRPLIELNLSKKIQEITLAWLPRIECGERIAANEIVAAIESEDVMGTELLQLASVLEAIYYVQKIFVDTSSVQAKAALNTFVNLNVSFRDQRPVQQAALFCVRRLEAITGISLVKRLGTLILDELQLLSADPVFRGGVVWITGLSGAGKSTLAAEVAKRLRDAGDMVVVLDGDELREVFDATVANAKNHGREGRLALALQYAHLCRVIANQGVTVVIATISLFKEVHAWNRQNLPGYFEVYLKVPVDELRRRDPKGIYRRFDAGELADVAGLDLPIDEPEAADWIVEFDPSRSVEAVAGSLLTHLTRKL